MFAARVWALLGAHVKKAWAVLAAHVKKAWAVLAAHVKKGWAVVATRVDAAASRRLSAFPLARSPELSPADSTPEPRKMNACPPPARRSARRALSFDILTNSFCRKPLVLIFIQTARGVPPSFFISPIFSELQNAPAPQSSVHDPIRPYASAGNSQTGGRKLGNEQAVGSSASGAGCYLQPAAETLTGT